MDNVTRFFASGFIPQAPKLCYPKVSIQNNENFSDWSFFCSFATGANDTGRAPWAVIISANFQKKFKTAIMRYSGALGKLIHEINLKPNISWHCPLKATQAWDISFTIFGLDLICTMSIAWNTRLILYKFRSGWFIQSLYLPALTYSTRKL
jgi:hypothetical protein